MTCSLDRPRIAILLATVHRPRDLARAVDSALRLEHPDFEVRIVDQSEDEDTALAVRPFLEDPRVHYRRQSKRGLSAGLNAAATDTVADLLAITGDDCVVRDSWLEEIEAAFAQGDDIGVLFGSVKPGPYDRDDGFIPGCLMDDELMARSLTDVHRLSGTTANMAIRRSVWQQLFGFDETLGIGAPLRSAEDLDLALRALLAGFVVLQTPRPEVEHCSPTLWRDRAATIRRNWYGSGAALAKSFKLSPVAMTLALVNLAGRFVRGGSGVAATYGPKPDRVAMLSGFSRGFLAGLFRGVDRRSRHFKRPPAG